jgi:serpin B
MKLLSLALLIPALNVSNEVGAMDRADPAAALVRGNTAFALDLYTQLRQEDGNRFLSPLSISTALAMTYAGAEGETALQMAKTLHFALPPDQLHAAFHRLLAELQGRNTTRIGSKETADIQLLSASALWSQSGERILPDFQKRIEVNYKGGLYPVDFRNAADEARRTINTWVEEQTREKIKDLLKPGQVSPQTRLILTNAIYFKAFWATPFSNEQTQPADFHVSPRDQVRVAMMHRIDRFRYLDESAFQAIELPYKGETLGLMIVLPKAIDGLTPLESSLTPERLETWTKRLATRRVQVSIPKFKLTDEFELSRPLVALGMPLAFQPGAADFSGMTGTRDFNLSAVVHKAFVEVEEKGTEAAAATGVVAVTAAVIATPPPVFRADHPFFFLIRDIRTGSILFLGRLTNPRG